MNRSRKNCANGFSLIELLIVVVIIGIIAAIAIPNLLASRRNANEGSAVSSIRVIFGAQATYRATEGNGFYADSLGELSTSGIVDKSLGCPSDPCLKSGYYFDVERFDGSPATHPPIWNAYATPMTPTGAMQTGSFSYYVNEIGSVYYKAGGSAPTAGISTSMRAPSDGIPLGN
jgi:type IV pilus assembly protein PilA